jgi:hypothetical protein
VPDGCPFSWLSASPAGTFEERLDNVRDVPNCPRRCGDPNAWGLKSAVAGAMPYWTTFPAGVNAMSLCNDAPGGSAGPDRDSLGRLACRFEAVWEQGPTPTLDDFVPLGDVRALAELVHIDLERRLKAGEAVRMENYLERFPALIEDAEAVLALIEAEYEQRRRREPGLSPAEYCWRFPSYAVQRRQRLTEEPPAGRDLPPTSDRPLTGHTTLPPGAAGRGAGQSSQPGLRYRPLRLHARGGLGEVLVAHDEEIDREVALKRIQEEYADDPESRRRFLQEGALTGRLEHPGLK